MDVIKFHKSPLLAGVVLLLVLIGQLHAGEICLDCHQATHPEAVSNIMSSQHGELFLQDFDGGGCHSCHGSSEQHIKNPKANSPDVVFASEDSKENAHEKSQSNNKMCLGCHQQAQFSHWQGSLHEQADLSCTDCHQLHQVQSPNLLSAPVQSLCTHCHTQQLVESQLPSRHPIKEGVTDCVDCHTPHGSLSEALLKKPTINETCYGCHAEKRGPFLFEHAPAAENCGECHNAHGSVNKPLLKSRPPFLCQQCHMVAGHPSVAATGSGLAGSANLLGKSCMNCHSQVHGSNHPSGPRFTR